MYWPGEMRWFLLGFVAATLAAAWLEPRPAAAQTAAGRGVPEGLTQPEASTRSNRGDQPPAAGDDDESSSGAAGESATEGDPDQSEDFVRPRAGQRGVVLDGDPNYPTEPSLPVDGVLETPEPGAPLDGADPTLIDTRDAEDRELFDNPPAGFDPLLFQIEELEPILDRRPGRLFRLEPYDPIGIRLGSFVYFPEAELAGGYFSNVFASPEAEKDVAAELKTTSRLVSNWKVHAVELKSTGGLSFYDEFDTENDRDYGLEARGRLDIARRTNLQAGIGHEHNQEGRSAIDASTVGERPDVDTTRGSVSFTHRFNRLEAQLRSSITETDISNSTDGFGNLVSSDDRDTLIYEETARLTYELKPSFALFVEGGLNQRDYKLASFSDGLRRDGEGQRYRVGIDFGEEGKILRGELSIGYGLQDPDAAALDEVDGFLFDANVTWRVTDLTALRLSGRTDITDTTTVGSGGVLTQQVGIAARHAFRRYFIGTAGVSYSTNDYGGVDLDESELRFNLDAEYFVNREIILFGKYQHTAFSSSEPDADWDGDEVRIGVKVRR
ncbi:MAG: outer membrane beta-barrel protein [Hyphomicrobium sp.]